MLNPNHQRWACFLTLAILAAASPSFAQFDRRERSEPGLVLETGAPTAATRVVQFTADGKTLLAAGDDKVLRLWPITANGFGKPETLRWSIWKERRGAIYALALSPDEKSIAIGGYGVRTGSVVIFNRTTGNIAHALTDTGNPNNAAVTYLAFSPSGSQVAIGADDGSVWLWDIAPGKKNAVRLIGRHADKQVRHLAFTTANQLISLARDGQLLRWNTAPEAPKDQKPESPAKFTQSTPILRVAYHSKKGLLAAIGETSKIELLSSPTLEGGAGGGKSREPKIIALPKDHFPHSLVFDASGDRLAVGVHSAVTPGFDLNHHVALYDLRPTPPKLEQEIKTTNTVTALTFTPDGNQLLLAGGNNHEVTLWDIRKKQSVAQIIGSGSSLWGVAVSERGGKFLGIREERDLNASKPNRRYQGAWRVFNLEKRIWATPQETKDFKPVETLETIDGWSVQPIDAFSWNAVNGEGKRFKIPLDRDRDGFPRCYVFLRPKDGKPLRLAVGHSHGISIFDVRNEGVRRVRLCTGHQGEVMAVAASGDGRQLYSASRDGTIAAWSLADWPTQAELGAEFRIREGKLFVESIDIGSPAWEAGLTKDDQITDLSFQARKVEGEADKWFQRLNYPVPGLELYFHLRRPGQPKTIESLTTVRQRPVWQFFPAKNREWVLWMTRSYYYDTSTNGDFHIGWQVNSGEGDVAGKPTFYKAEQFRKRFHRPDVIDKLLNTVAAVNPLEDALRVAERNPLPARFPDIEPPKIQVDAVPQIVKDQSDVTLTIQAAPRGPLDGQKPDQYDLWINEFRFKSWNAEETAFPLQLTIPRKLLRSGNNQLTFQGFNRSGGRADAIFHVRVDQPPVKPDLYGLVAGIGDYSNAKSLANLPCTRLDAEVMQQRWQNQNKLYGRQFISLHVDEQALPENVLAELKKIGQRAKPDDCLVVFLAGHGDLVRDQPGAFAFCGPLYDRGRPEETGITSRTLYEALATLPCRKLVFLDACHAGDAITNPIRSLTPGGKGPVILAACDLSEHALEHVRYGHGLFTYAVLEAMEESFARADANRDGFLNPNEIFQYVEARLPELLRELKAGQSQNPISFPLQMEGFPVVTK